MSDIKDSFLDLERHRLQLEENVKGLRRALQHWQTWDAEYEALKEEVEEVPESNEAELTRIRNDFEGELVNGQEIDEIFGKPTLKSKEQIANILERRIEYVSKNVETLQKQVETAENKYAAATVISQPDATDEDGQPFTEIIEELDDEDNVISYRLNKPGESLPQVREVLEKAGVKDLPEMEHSEQRPDRSEPSHEKPSPKRTAQPASSRQSQEARVKAEVRETPEISVKKTVSFSDDTKPVEPQPQVARAAKRVEHIMNTAKEQESVGIQDPLLPEDENPEDAALRQEMLKFSMGEVGAVVAELQLDGEYSDDDYEFDYSDEGFDEEEDEEEDSHGRYKGSIVTDAYRQRMLELEKKLGITSRFTDEAPDPSVDGDADSGSDDERIGRIVVNRSDAAASSVAKPVPVKSNIKEKQSREVEGKKGVRFADSLFIDSKEEPPSTAILEREAIVEPLSDIVERSGPVKPTEAKSARKPSRFKKTRAETPPGSAIPKGPLDVPLKFLDQDRPTAPTGPEGTTIADTLVERDRVSAPIPPDDFDNTMVHDEVADEYHRMRRKFIQREGGFLKEDESPIQPLDEADGGERISRFKAARLSRQ